MKRIISYSLYGSKLRYLVGALRNAASAPEFYPGWQTRFYVGPSVPHEFRTELEERGGEVVPVAGREDSSAMFWRFRAFADPGVEWVMVRDCDSRFSLREKSAVQEWLSSVNDFHIMRDHPAHDAPILGGLWGARTAPLRHLATLIHPDRLKGHRGEDQEFLAAHVYPLARKSSCVHDSFFFREWWRRAFPGRREGSAFVGEVFDERERPRQADRDSLARLEASGLSRAKIRIASFVRGALSP